MAKQNFSTKISDVKQSSYEEMKAASEGQETDVITDPEYDREFEKEPLTSSASLNPAPQIVIPPGSFIVDSDQLKQLIDRGIQERLNNAPSHTAPKAKQVAENIKVESTDDLPEFANWEIKDRLYVLCSGFSSLSQGIKDRHKKHSPLMHNGRALRYSTSQASFFMDKQVGEVLLSYITIENGRLFVPKENTHLQKFLAIHPDRNVVFKEFDAKAEAKTAYDAQKIKIDAYITMNKLDNATLVSIAMLMNKDFSEGSDLYTIKRDLFNEIDANPKLFLKLASDQNLKLKTIGKTAVFRGLLKYENYRFLDENDVVLCEVNRNENEYDALASYFSSSEGRTLFEYISQKLSS